MIAKLEEMATPRRVFVFVYLLVVACLSFCLFCFGRASTVSCMLEGSKDSHEKKNENQSAVGKACAETCFKAVKRSILGTLIISPFCVSISVMFEDDAK